MNATTAYRHVAGRPLVLNPLPDSLKNHPAVATANLALDKVDELHQVREAVMSDPTLSPLGKSAKLAKPISNMLRAVAGASAVNAISGESADKREADMLAVPELAKTDAPGAAIDVEVRQWWRALPANERLQMLQKFNESPDHQRIEAALLRSPVALADPELLSIRDGWNRQARMNNQNDAFAIDRDRHAIAWSDAAIGHAAGIATSMAGMDRQSMLHTIVTGNNPLADGARAFGFSQREIDGAKVFAQSENAE